MNSEFVLSTKFNTAIALETVEFIKDFDCYKTSRRYNDDVKVISQQFDRLLSMFDQVNDELSIQYIENGKLKFFSCVETEKILHILKSELIKRKKEHLRI